MMRIPSRHCQCILLLLLASTIHEVSSQQDDGELDCVEGLRQFNSITQKRVYNVGVHASAGIETARMEFNLTFEEYLNEAVGKRWEPPIEFQMKVTDDSIRDWLDMEEEVDFMYTDTGIYSCIGIEIGAQPLATTISRLNSRGIEYDLDVFAGTIMTLADNDQINSIQDLKGKVIGAQNFADFAGSQAQMYMMLQENVNPFIDVKKVIFTGNNEDTIQGILDGRWDVGFVRTGQIERTINPSTGKLVNRDLLKVIAPRIHVMDNGELFPFLHSTPVFPEWPFAAKDNLDHIVTSEVSRALIALSSHATVGRLIAECYEAATTEAERRTCDTSPPEYFYASARCDTTRELATLAYNAELAGFHTGFRPPRSHFAVRTMQQDGGFIFKNDKNKWSCERNSNYYNGIICPDGYYKVDEGLFASQCDDKGLVCADGYSCFCEPCIKAFDVAVFPKYITDAHVGERTSEFNIDNGCTKMSVCGEFQQRELAILNAFDNLRRENATMMIKKHEGETEVFIPGRQISPFLYEFEFSRSSKGLSILEIFVDGEQIPESPVQVETIERDCEAAYPGFNRVPDADGECICPLDTIQVDGSCVPSDIREVAVYPWMVAGESVLNLTNDASTAQSGCDKMSLCGTVPQTKEIVFQAEDNKKRMNATVTALLLLGIEERWLPVTEMEPHVYQFGFSHNERGVAIVELFFDGIQIPSSPFRVDVKSRDCDTDFPGQLMVPNDVGSCKCSDSTIEIGGTCMPLGIFTGTMATVGVLIAFMIVYCAFRYKRKVEDKVWHVNPEELNFSYPVETIGQGAFGVVLAAEYRGTRVAIKRVIPVETARTRGASAPSNAGGSGSIAILSKNSDVEEGGDSPATGPMSNNPDLDSRSESSLSDALGDLPLFEKKTRLQRMFPFLFQDQATRMKLSMLGSNTSGSITVKSLFAKICPKFDETARREEEFKTEMRLLSRLRHPCITTVMGAVMTGRNPMMVMELMENGSLYDLLRNETLYTGGEMIMQIVRDVAQGIRFLHGSSPPTLHRDLKAKNILIDSRFRAKVADFGLATRNKNRITGTPFWMAPEYLLGKTEYTTSCDIYAFGMIMYEIYSRKIPYEGLHPRKVLRKVCDPRINYRPKIPDTCPQRMAEVMTKCWSSNTRTRPEAEDLDRIFAEMNAHDAEPLIDQETTRLRTEVASGDMLYQVFPKKVADQLKAGQKVEAETHNKATVLFMDIVRFEDISQAMSSGKVNWMLDRLHAAFRGLANKHGVFQVETIGDVWVGVTNLDGNQNSTNVKQIANFAIAAVATANNILIDEEDPSAGYVHIRVGFHSGPVVSNVIGSRNPRFALFGETMTTAARMESLSTSDRIQCSEVSARILKEQAPEIPLQRRGKTAVKGKGHMITYWVGNPTSGPRNPVKSPIKNVPAATRGFDAKPTVGFHPSFHKSDSKSSVADRDFDHKPTVGLHPSFQKASGTRSSAAATRTLDDIPNHEFLRSSRRTARKKKKGSRWAAPTDFDPSNSMPISILQKPRKKSIQVRRLSASSSISISE